MKRVAARGFTLVEVLVALMIVAMGLAALMSAVSGTARASGYLRDKTLAQWIALNRLAEVRLNLNKMGDNNDTGQLDFANRTWHYDTRYFDTNIPSMKRLVVRVWLGDANTKGNPVAEATGFLGTALGTPGGSNVVWTQGSVPTTGTGTNGTTGTVIPGTQGISTTPTGSTTQNP
jgi:general secretion pathway protein I